MRISIGVTALSLLLMSAIASPVVVAQRPSADSGSQRILPLPEGRLSDFQTQMELLQRLRSLVAASDAPDQTASAASDSAPNIDAKQLEQLQQALKQLQAQLPPGVTPPDLGAIPKEQLDEAMSNPVVQRQLKEMLKQFSRDGLLPRDSKDSGSSQLPPLPKQAGESQSPQRGTGRRQSPPPVPQEVRPPDSPRIKNSNPGNSTDPDTQNFSPDGNQEQNDSGSNVPQGLTPARESWQSLKDAMKRVSEIAKNGNTPSQDNAPPRLDSTGSAAADEPSSSGTRIPENPGRNPGNVTDLSFPTDDTDADSGFEHRQKSLQAFQDLLERYKNAQQDYNDPDVDAASDDHTLPEIRPGSGSQRQSGSGRTSGQESERQVLRRPDRETPMEPPVNFDRRNSEQGEVFPPFQQRSGDRFPRNSRDHVDSSPPSDNASESNVPGSPSNPLSELPPSVSEFLKQQLRDGFPTPGSQQADPRSQSRAANRNPDLPSSDDSARDGAARTREADSSNQNAPSNMDIRSELEKRGLRGTLEKLVEKARQESSHRQAQAERDQSESITNQSGTAQASNLGDRTTDDPGFKKSIQNLLGGLDHQKMEDIVRDANFKDRPADSSAHRDSTWQQSPPDSGTRSKSWNSAATDFLKDLSVAPQAPSVTPSSGGGVTSMSPEVPLAMGSFLLVSLGLLAIVGVIVFLMRRPLLKMVSDATGMTGPKPAVRANDIRSRDDVIAAFHHLVLNPKQAVEAWWTHRAAARTIAAASPQREVAVQTLAEIYEQARYLPDDVELPDDKIQSARSALAECQ